MEPEKMTPQSKLTQLMLAGVAACAVSACTHTVRLEPSDKPIKIDLNIKIDQQIRVKLDKEVDELITENPDLF
jgi:YnbE-like lipoprotein